MPTHALHTPQVAKAFSCYIFDAQGRVLITRRALGKRVWPGVWSNSLHGHAQPGEALDQALLRRSACELGIAVEQVELLMDDFSQPADPACAGVEVFRAVTRDAPLPAPDEVMEWQWVKAETVLSSASATPFLYSPWMVAQLEAILVRGLYLRWRGNAIKRSNGRFPYRW
ncbi:isopentenyl-diphosphate Delta-isomerase [Pseudomonas sp. App30]|uniref:isopentenyl-diphosphate Delta-isomerase n=1 Tax=Pseudomonas sp. App30 TaxID=3068990 RepID=UPI003A80AFB3